MSATAVSFVSSQWWRICGSGGQTAGFKGLIDEVRIYKALPGAEQIAILACPDSLTRIASISPHMRTEAQRLKLRNAFLEQAAPDTARQAWTRLRELERERAAIETAVPTVMVMQELPEPRPTFVLKRQPRRSWETVSRGVPAVLPPMAKVA
jgi:hypothetical protein